MKTSNSLRWLIAVPALTAILLGSPVSATIVECGDGETWDDPRTTEELLEIGAWELCSNGGGIRDGSRISDEQRVTINAVVLLTVVAPLSRRR